MGQVFVNSYGSSQISAKGLFGSNQTVNEIIVPKIDTTKIIAGTFWFDAISPAADTVHVREGRFDMRYTQ